MGGVKFDDAASKSEHVSTVCTAIHIEDDRWFADFIRGLMSDWPDIRHVGAASTGTEVAVNLNEERWDDLFPEFLARWAPGRLVVVYCDDRCVASQEVARRLRGDF